MGNTGMSGASLAQCRACRHFIVHDWQRIHLRERHFWLDVLVRLAPVLLRLIYKLAKKG